MAGTAKWTALLFLAALLWFGMRIPSNVTVWSEKGGENTAAYVLDAGHGGEDGGAVSPGGVKESEINLAMVKKLDQLLGFYGAAPVVLRQEDISLHDAGAATLREKKVSDLKNRVSAIEAVEHGTLISIHQNSYPERRYRGTQVFYSDTEGSQELAQRIQAIMKQTIQPENKRDVKVIPDTVYLMNHITCRAVLVECGFLTNPEDERLLVQDVYQRKFASVLLAVLLQDAENEVEQGLQDKQNLVQ